MKRPILTAYLAAAALAAVVPAIADPAKPAPGRRTDHLLGYGIVTGLPGTGDNFQNCPQLTESLKSMIGARGDIIGIDPAAFRGRTAAVMVTAEMPISGAKGEAIDVRVSAMCDSKSLADGALMVTALIGADAKVYAVGTGTLKSCSDEANDAHVPTRACIVKGATIVRPVS